MLKQPLRVCSMSGLSLCSRGRVRAQPYTTTTPQSVRHSPINHSFITLVVLIHTQNISSIILVVQVAIPGSDRSTAAGSSPRQLQAQTPNESRQTPNIIGCT